MSKLLVASALSIALLSFTSGVQADAHGEMAAQIEKLRQDKQTLTQRLDRAIAYSKNSRADISSQLEQAQQSLSAEQAKRKELSDRLRRAIAYSKSSREAASMAMQTEQDEALQAEKDKRRALADRLRRAVAYSKASRADSAMAMENQQAALQAEKDKRRALADRLRRAVAYSKESRATAAMAMQEDHGAALEAEKDKRQAVSNRLRRAIAFSKTSRQTSSEKIAALESQLAKPTDAAERNWASSVSNTLASSIGGQQGTSVRTLSDNSVKILVGNNGLFSTGGTGLSANGARLMSSIAQELAPIDANVNIVGYTDNVPVGNSSRFNNNEDLSFARATSTLRMLREKGIANNRLSASGFGAESPIASNDTPEGRQQNRRVEIVLTQQ